MNVASDAVTRAMLQAIPDMMFRIRRDGTYVDFIGPSDAPLVAPELFIGKTMSELLPPAVAADLDEALQRAITTREVTTVTYELEYPGERRVFEARIAAIDQDEVISTVRDVTAHFRQREELDAAIAARTAELEQARAALRELSHRLVMVEEEERRALAREIHDHSAQLVTGLQLAVETWRREMPDGSRQAELVQSIAGELARHVHDLSLDLRPPLLDRDGLVPALNAHVERFSARTGLRIDMKAAELPRFDAYLEHTAFRITQEALTNAARAGAQSVVLQLAAADGQLEITIDDDGRGFDTDHVDLTQSSGLSGMRERALLAGGNIRFGPSSSKGVCVRISLPVHNHLNDDDCDC